VKKTPDFSIGLWHVAKNVKNILKSFYPHTCSIAKFDGIFLWMIASLATSQIEI
jgi:hypothetical protein